MNNNMVKQIFESTIKAVVANQRTFIKFLDFVSKLYQFKTVNLLLIYAQRPEAQMVKSIEKWNESKRTINKDSKGIAIYKKKSVSFVFELNDTSGETVELEKKNIVKSPVEKKVREEYDERFLDHESLILKKVEGTFLEDLDQHSIKVAFRETVVSSAIYILEKHYDDARTIADEKEFKWVSQFNSTESAFLLLSTSVMLAKEILNTPAIEYPQNSVETLGDSLNENEMFEAAKEKLMLKNLDKAEMKIVEYLISILDDDFTVRIMLKEKSFKNCMQFIFNKVKDLAKSGAAIVDDEDVYKMAKEYFLEDDLKEDKLKEEVKQPAMQAKMIHSSVVKEEKSNQVSLFDGAVI